MTAQAIERPVDDDTDDQVADVKQQLGEVFADVRQSIAERAARREREAS